jgi:ankyrin repeat protein
MAGLSITGQMKVSTLQEGFLKEFGLTLRVYDGRAFADPTQTLAQVRKKKGSGKDLSVAKNMKVGNLEDKFEEEFGLKVQVAGSDDSYLCKDELSLNAAQQEDEKKLARKERKAARQDEANDDGDDDEDEEVDHEFEGLMGNFLNLSAQRDSLANLMEEDDDESDKTIEELEAEVLAELEEQDSDENSEHSDDTSKVVEEAEEKYSEGSDDDDDNNSKLLKAIENRDVDAVSYLIEGFNKINETFSRPDNKDESKWTYLLHSCKFGNMEIVHTLLGNGADLSNEDSKGKRPLYWASTNSEDEEAARICTLFIEKGVDVNHKSTDGKVALFAALIARNNKTLKILLGAGADPNIQESNLTCFAASFPDAHSTEAVKILLEHDNLESVIENSEKNYRACLSMAEPGLHICAAWQAITSWLFYETALAHKEVYDQSIQLAFSILIHSHDTDPQLFSNALGAGAIVGAVQYKKMTMAETSFRTFMKNLGVTGMGQSMESSDVGDLGMLLLSTLQIVKEYEPPEVIKKLERDINDICIHQLDCESILKDIQGAAQTTFIELKDDLFEKHPIQTVEKK